MESYIQKIKIDKVRHLENIEIDISENEKKHLILTGKNGSGKTSVIERVRDYFQSIFNYVNYVVGDDNEKKLKIFQVHMSQLEGESSKDSIKLNRMFVEKYTSGLGVIFNSEVEIKNKYETGQFIIAYFGAKRNINIAAPENIPKIELKDKYQIGDNLGDVFLNYLVYLKTQQSFARNENDMEEVENITTWFERFEEGLRTIIQDDSLKLKFNYKELNFEIRQDNREPYGFDALSDGYSAVLDIIVNLILRMEKKRKNAYDIEGIVLIDEIETHLHIELQKQIMPFLTSFFPNVQFIVTTHSPFIINSIENAVIYDLEKQKRVEDLSGLAYEGVVEAYFDMDQYSDKIRSKLERYREIVFKKNRSEDEEDEIIELRRYLKSISPELSPEVAIEFSKIEISRKIKNH